MDTAGSIIQNDGKTLYVFGTAVAPDTFLGGNYVKESHIGVNLDTGKVDDIVSNYVSTMRFEELTIDQQLRLTDALRYRVALTKNVVTVSAKARSGKDYLSDYVKETFKQKTVNVKALADPIRSVRTVLFGESTGKDRAPLIMIGQGLRKEDPNIWLKVWLRTAIEDIKKTYDRKFICQDVRQPNEFSFFKSLGALTVKVEADEEKRLNKIREVDGEAALDKALLNDETESHVGGFNADIAVFNNYDDQFIKDVDSMVVTALIERGW